MKLFYGHFIHSLSLNELEIINGFMLIDQFGIIVDIQKSIDYEKQFEKLMRINEINEVIILSKHQFLIPGFIDSHFHAPQIVNLGRGHELTLLDWLNKYTFPREAEFKDTKYALEIYSNLIKTLLRHGTTTVSFFSTIHLEATKILADCMMKFGQRGYVGKVCMDQHSPEYYVETHDDCVRDNIKMIEYLKDSTLVSPIITPRFAISCSPKLLLSLGNIAELYDLPIQSHLSENKNEIEFVNKLFPNLNYTQVYDEHNLLNNKTIMAHCVHLSDKEIDLFKKRDAGISHCPTSNINLMSGFLDVKRLLKQDIKIGLGSDVSAGSSCSILNAINDAISVSRVINKENGLNLKEAFYLATLGNAALMNLENKIGNFGIGKW